MEIAFALNTHTKETAAVEDTVDSIVAHGTDKILVVVEESAWPYYRDLRLPAAKMQGFRHTGLKSPYRNVALSLKVVSETWPCADWYCYCEYDVLFGSDRYKHNLKMAEEMDVWMLGNDGHVDEQAMPLVQAILGESIRSSYYLLGCCQFFHKDFMAKLHDISFFDRFLTMTSGFADGHFPLYSGYDISEHMYPSLCRHFGGNVGVFATWDAASQEWHGAGEYFPMRWRPALDVEKDHYKEASIMHPVKSSEHPARTYHKEKRKNGRVR